MIMLLEYRNPRMGSYFALTDEQRYYEGVEQQHKGLIHIFWHRGDSDVLLRIDDIELRLAPRQVVTLTFLHKVVIPPDADGIVYYSFNKEFYCVHTHDEEVSCNGLIFFGAQHLPVITLDDLELRKFGLLHEVFLDEFRTRDRIQGEMLQMLLKRLIIKITRLAKEQGDLRDLNDSSVDLIRKYNTLVDRNFKDKKQVAHYAELLFKSPKTLSNLFAKYGQRTPLQIIHDRIVLEAKRQLLYTEKTVKEIAFELGFDDVASFHKLFKKQLGIAPQQFKKASESRGSEMV